MVRRDVLPTSGELLPAFMMRVSQEAVVPHTYKVVWQDVLQKSPDELVCWQYSVFAAVTIVAISVGERHLAIAAANQASLLGNLPFSFLRCTSSSPSINPFDSATFMKFLATDFERTSCVA